MIKKPNTPEIVSAGQKLIVRSGFTLDFVLFSLPIHLLEYAIDQREKTIQKKEKFFFLTIKKKLLRLSDILRIEYRVQTKGTKSEIIKSFQEKQVEWFSILLITRQNEQHLVWETKNKFVKSDEVNQLDLQDDEGHIAEGFDIHPPELAVDLDSVLFAERLAHILDVRIKTIPPSCDPFRDCPSCGRQAAKVRYSCRHCHLPLGAKEKVEQR